VTNNTIDAAVRALRNGELIIVTDDEVRENEGDLFLAAEFATPERLAFIIRHTSGVVCVALPESRCDELQLPPMVRRNEDTKGTAFTVSVDAREGTTTGISAAERAGTIRRLGDPATVANDLRRPGHIFPLRAHPQGTMGRRGHTEAGVDLMRLAGLNQACALSELANEDGSMMRGAALDEFAEKYGLVKVTMDQVVEARAQLAAQPRDVKPVAVAQLPRPGHEWQASAFIGIDGDEHLLLTLGDLATSSSPLLRLHSECLTGDVFSSLRCDCGAQLDAALEAIEAEGVGAILYMAGHEGRGIGLANKIRAYNLQDLGADTVDANSILHLPVDARSWRDSVDILKAVGITSCRLMTHNPQKAAALTKGGIAVEIVDTPTFAQERNRSYLRTKRERLGHTLELDDRKAETPKVSNDNPTVANDKLSEVR